MEQKNRLKGNAIFRYGRYLLLKLNKIKATPYAVAAGFACGSAISFTPFVGFHTLLAMLTALCIRGNLVAAAVGTVVGNPWTFPMIWPATLYTGRFLLGGHDDTPIRFARLFKNLAAAVRHWNFDSFASDIWPLLKPMMVGCVPYYLVAWVVSYYFIKKTMDRFAARRAKLRGEQ
jgi:hypothetical protein